MYLDHLHGHLVLRDRALLGHHRDHRHVFEHVRHLEVEAEI